MKVIEHFKRAESTLFSIEILPPVKGSSIQSVFDGIDPLVEFKPAFVDVTYHREEYLIRKGRNGEYRKVLTRKRPGTVGISAAIKNRYNIDTVPHIICGGFSKEETENALLDLHFLGIDNVLALRGDSLKDERVFVPDPDGHYFASELVEQIVGMNEGRYLDDNIAKPDPTDFCIGVAGYPEKHFEATNFEKDLQYLKHKVDLGAEYIVTQMFFDNAKFFNFVDKCREIGINVPIVPGIKPLSTLKHIEILPKLFYTEFPEPLMAELKKCQNNDDVKAVGTEWGIAQCKELIEYGVPCLHFYTMGKSETTRRIAEGVF